MKKTLHLNLKRKWFDMILSGEKKEEYREIKKHWISQLFIKNKNSTHFTVIEFLPMDTFDISYFQNHFSLKLKSLDTITFSNGYKKDRPQFEIELKNIKIDSGKTEWGAEPNKKYFVLELGNIIDGSIINVELKNEKEN